MQRLVFLSLFVICLAFTAKGQTPLNAQNNSTTSNLYTISGVLKDTINLTATGYASVSLINASDSILQKFTRTDQQGHFQLTVDHKGKYIILIAHPSFASFVDIVDVEQEKTDLGDIIMYSKRQMLDEVKITDAKAVVIKGDTVEYTADSFKTRQYDNVDELLKKLPGIEVDRAGKIKAYGQEVKNMTVDGEEFFSDDPAVVAQTLRASGVEKVQVFDKKSDQATFSGIDDGERTKTINLKLKESAKQGYFGKVSAGGGLPSYWENQAMINAFKKKRKISAFGIMSNTNSNGLNWDDNRKFGSGGNGINYLNDDDGSSIWDNSYGDNNDVDLGGWGGQFRGQGLPKTWTGGASYSNNWLGDSLDFNGNYKFGKMITEGLSNSRTQYILPDTQYVNTNNSTNTSIRQQQSANAVLSYDIDTSSSIRVTLGGKYSKSENLGTSVSESAASDGSLINHNDTKQNTNSENKALNTEVFYRKRFKKKGRTFSADFKGRWTDASSNGILNSNYNLYAIDSAYSLNQNKVNTGNTLTGSLSLAYTEPLSKALDLAFNYSVGLINNDAENSSYDRTVQGGEQTETFNPLYSSHYIYNILQNQGGALLKFNTKKVYVSIGGNVSNTNMKQEDKLFDTSYQYSYLNFFPKASFTFRRSQMESFSIRYNGSSQQPSLTQLQPLRNNNDPLNITIGNPNLKQSFNHRISVNMNSYKQLSSRNIYVSGSVNFIQNAISNRQTIDESGRQVNQYVNVDGNYNANVYAGYYKHIWELNTRVSGNINQSHNNNFINGLANGSNTLSFSPDFGISRYKDTTYEISYDFSPGYNRSTSSIRPDIVTKYWNFGQRLDGNYNLPMHFEIGTSIDWNIRQRVDPNDKNNNVFLWNAYINKSFLKDKSLVASFSANDLLNQNKGYSRVNNPNYISETTNNVIQRYFMLKLTWNFTKTGAKAAKSDEVKVD